MITLTDYFTGPGHIRRDQVYAKDLNDNISDAASKLLPRVNFLIGMMDRDRVALAADPSTGSMSHSGWRPPEVNAATPNAAIHSKHMTGHAIDVWDPEGSLDAWCLEHQAELEHAGLWFEHPSTTKGWCHLQDLPYGSFATGKPRWFYP